MSDLSFRPMRPEPRDLELFGDCFAANGDTKDARHLEWQYLKNPDGRLFVDFAVDAAGDQLGGIYATFPVSFQIGSRRVTGVQSLDTMTDQAHRGKGLFTKLAAALYERCQDSDVALVYGFPNGSSAHGFFERLAWTRLDPVPFLLLPIRPAYFLRRLRLPDRMVALAPARFPRRRPPTLAADEEIVTLDRVDAEVDALWDTFSQHVRVAVVRDHEYLRWRLRRPGAHYKVLAFRRAGELRGLAICTVRDKHGGRVGYVMELLHVPDDHRAGECLLAAVVEEMASAGAEVALAWSLEHSPNHDAFRQLGFWTLPERLRPIELHFGVRALAAPADAALGNRSNWYLSYLDSDTV